MYSIMENFTSIVDQHAAAAILRTGEPEVVIEDGRRETYILGADLEIPEEPERSVSRGKAVNPVHHGRFPTIPYPGGKGRLAPTLVSFMPPKGRLYLEPFVGRGNVFWAAASSRLGFEKWALNDIRTAPFFEAVRDIGDTIEVPLRSREEYYRQWAAFRQRDPAAILLEPYLTFGGGGYGKGGFGGKKSANAPGYTRTMRTCHALMRSTNAQVTGLDWESLDWASLGEEDFVFFDPPYIGGDVRAYKSDIDYVQLVELLKGARFRWMLIEYGSDIYLRELGPPRWTKEVQLIALQARRGGRRTECLWTSY